MTFNIRPFDPAIVVPGNGKSGNSPRFALLRAKVRAQDKRLDARLRELKANSPVFKKNRLKRATAPTRKVLEYPDLRLPGLWQLGGVA